MINEKQYCICGWSGFFYDLAPTAGEPDNYTHCPTCGNGGFIASPETEMLDECGANIKKITLSDTQVHQIRHITWKTNVMDNWGYWTEKLSGFQSKQKDDKMYLEFPDGTRASINVDLSHTDYGSVLGNCTNIAALRRNVKAALDTLGCRM